jgi:biopolymer transport protein ExbD
MKIGKTKRIHYDSGPNTTPLVDIVMVILIFFMLAGSFGMQEHFLVSTIPASVKGIASAAPPPNWIPPTELEIRVESRGGHFVATVGNREITDKAELEATLKHMYEKFPDPQSVQVRINPGRDAEYTDVIVVYDAAVGAQFAKIGFNTSLLYR